MMILRLTVGGARIELKSLLCGILTPSFLKSSTMRACKFVTVSKLSISLMSLFCSVIIVYYNVIRYTEKKKKTK